MQINQNYPNNPYGAQMPYPQSYGYSPYANMPPRFAPTVQPIQAPQPVQQPVMQQPAGLSGRFVQSAEQVVANDVPMDGSVAVFPKQDMSEIYAKQWNSDGTIQTVVYRPVTTEQPKAADPAQDKFNYDAIMGRLDELSGKIDQIGKSMTGTRTVSRKKEVVEDD